ncbi:glycerol-3-phosphate dehydrogenase [Candidatus Marinamargulisbacteria bacterium SCGC AG-410-N11]|nr:glycerol-3-phosphate dehydrogenase [Candidatus Marinamargulisbacteria bacterium SCGC AG-410-N11]
MRQIGVIGCGSWPITIANLIAKNGFNVLVWCHRSEIADDINLNSSQSKVFPELVLADNVRASTKLEDVVSLSDGLIYGVPSLYFKYIEQISSFYKAETPFLVLSKGLINCKETPFFSEYVKLHLNKVNLAVLSGPNLASEIINELPAATVVAAEDNKTSMFFQEKIHSNRFRVYNSNDLVGVELAGILKNIIAIAAGALDGLELGMNAKAALVTRGLAEIIRFCTFFKGKVNTMYGLAGIGDLLVTSSSKNSRNWNVGYFLAKGDKLDLILDRLGAVAEGIYTVKIVYQLSKKYNIDMPICNGVFEFVHNGAPAEKIYNDLMNRQMKNEN